MNNVDNIIKLDDKHTAKLSHHISSEAWVNSTAAILHMQQLDKVWNPPTEEGYSPEIFHTAAKLFYRFSLVVEVTSLEWVYGMAITCYTIAAKIGLGKETTMNDLLQMEDCKKFLHEEMINFATNNKLRMNVLLYKAVDGVLSVITPFTYVHHFVLQFVRNYKANYQDTMTYLAAIIDHLMFFREIYHIPSYAVVLHILNSKMFTETLKMNVFKNSLQTFMTYTNVYQYSLLVDKCLEKIVVERMPNGNVEFTVHLETVM